jgi:hypothetical protein
VAFSTTQTHHIMSKVTLGQKPKQFKPFPVSYPAPDGTEETVKVTYKYRTRTEFGAWLDQLVAKPAQAVAPVYLEDGGGEQAAAPVYLEDVGTEIARGHMEEFFDTINVSVADFLLGCVDAWDADIPLTREGIVQYADEKPAGVEAIMTGYRIACREGRLGN